MVHVPGVFFDLQRTAVQHGQIETILRVPTVTKRSNLDMWMHSGGEVSPGFAMCGLAADFDPLRQAAEHGYLIAPVMTGGV
jgi:hypothetical protein